MNFKIESNYISINNYPFMEEHFEKKARKGWLISKVFQGSIFIYKRIKPEDLDFSITPYETESFFTMKTKADLEEFHSVCQHVGWNYAAKTSDLHIYYKEKSDDAIPLETDDEELFKALESLGKKQEMSIYFSSIYLFFLSWFILGWASRGIRAMKDGLELSLAFLLPAILVLGVIQIVDLNRFVTRNQKNIEVGLALTFDNSMKPLYRIIFIYSNIFFALAFFHIIYGGFILKNKIIIISLLPGTVGLSIGSLFRFIIKPKRMGNEIKGLGLVFAILITVAVNVFVIYRFVDNFLDKENLIPNIEDYKIISMEDLGKEESLIDFSRNSSFLIPRSYESYSYGKGEGSIRTEYSKTVNEAIAKNLVNRYIKRAKRSLIGQTKDFIDYSLSSGQFDSFLTFYGINEDDFNKLKGKEKVTVRRGLQEIGFAASIIKSDEKFWGVDEAYFLDYRKTEIILRKSNEVIYINLEGMDFLDGNIMEGVKVRLGL